MSSTLAQFRTRIAAFLLDEGATVFSETAIDEALRLALYEYSDLFPCGMESLLTLPGTGREVALNSLAGLVNVTDAWWPYHSALAEEWPPNEITGFRVWWDDGAPVLFLSTLTGNQPQRNDEVRVWWAKSHTIEGLDDGAMTTLPLSHEALLMLGAAGYAASTRAVDVVGAYQAELSQMTTLRSWGADQLAEFRKQLWKRRSK